MGIGLDAQRVFNVVQKIFVPSNDNEWMWSNMLSDFKN